MNKRRIRIAALAATVVGLLTSPYVGAQQDVVVTNWNDYYSPESVVVEQGDTVTFRNPRTQPITHHHDLFFTNDTHPGHGFASSWTHEVVFESVGEFEFGCSRHGERGTVTVLAGSGGPSTIDMNPGLNGSWWNGPDRNGEGVQIEISDGGSGERVLVATIYAYAPGSGQIFLIAVGNPSGDSAEVDVFITEGGTWGAGLGPGDVTENPWGTGTFTSESCEVINMTLTPNAEFAALGYTNMSYDLVRLTVPLHSCPPSD